MKKLLVVGVIVLFLSVSVIPSTGTRDVKQITMPINSRNTLYVGGIGPNNYTKIQDAIDDASEGDTVFVYNGTYVENLIVDKSINLVGEDRNITIVDGIQGIKALQIISNKVTVRGFTIQHSYEGIYIEDYMDYNIIESNVVSYNKRDGIKLVNSPHNKIIGNIVFNNGKHGIVLHGCIQNDIKDNIISYNNENGVLLFHSHNNNFSGNTITDNNYYGFYSFKSDNVNLFSNTFINHSVIAIHIAYSSNNTVSKNIIINSTYSGIRFCHSHNKNRIFRNTLIYNNGFGIDLWNCSNHEIFWNNIRENNIGILLKWANNNYIYSNNVIQNNIDAFFVNCFKNTWRSNFWSRTRFLPYPIFGMISVLIPWLNFDWHPAQEPYDIEV